MVLRRRGIYYVEIAIACTLMMALTVEFVRSDGRAIGQGRDARLRADVEGFRQALAAYLLAHDGRPPREARELVRYLIVPGGEDPLAWRGSAGRGRIAVVAGSIVLRDQAGGEPAGTDAFGRAYADYR